MEQGSTLEDQTLSFGRHDDTIRASINAQPIFSIVSKRVFVNSRMRLLPSYNGCI